MTANDYQSWEDLLATILVNEVEDSEHLIRVERQTLAEIAEDLARLVYATERRFQDTADRLIFEHRERFRQDLIQMNNIRIRLNALLRAAR